MHTHTEHLSTSLGEEVRSIQPSSQGGGGYQQLLAQLSPEGAPTALSKRRKSSTEQQYFRKILPSPLPSQHEHKEGTKETRDGAGSKDLALPWEFPTQQISRSLGRIIASLIPGRRHLIYVFIPGGGKMDVLTLCHVSSEQTGIFISRDESSFPGAHTSQKSQTQQLSAKGLRQV